MVDVRINHRFISTKPDSADPSLVSSSEWNDFALLGQGAQGQHVARDIASLSGASWADGPRIVLNNQTYSGASPSPSLAAITFSYTMTNYLLITAMITTITSGGSSVLVDVRRDGAVVDQFTTGGTGLATSYSFVIAEATGTHTYAIVAAATTGTFNSLGARLVAFSIGAV